MDFIFISYHILSSQPNLVQPFHTIVQPFPLKSKLDSYFISPFIWLVIYPKIGQFHPNHHGYTRGNVYSPYHISTSSCLTITGADQTQSVCQPRSSNRRNLWSPLNLSNPFINKWGSQTHFVPWSQSILSSWANFWSPYHFLHVINSWGKPKHTWCPETKSNWVSSLVGPRHLIRPLPSHRKFHACCLDNASKEIKKFFNKLIRPKRGFQKWKKWKKNNVSWRREHPIIWPKASERKINQLGQSFSPNPFHFHYPFWNNIPRSFKFSSTHQNWGSFVSLTWISHPQCL